MKTKKIITASLAILSLSSFLISCDKDDTPANPISRLYVSTADTDPIVQNLEIYDPADISTPTIMPVATGTKDGNGIIVDISTDRLFQVRRAAKSVSIFSNASTLTGTPTATATFTDASLSSGREIAYDKNNNTLFVANNSDSTIRVYNNASNLSGAVTGKVLKISGQPWGIHFDAAGNRLLVLMDLAAMRIEVYNNPSSIAAGVVTSNAVLNITDRPNGGKSRLHGLTYSSSLNVLLITEIGEAAAPGTPDITKPAFNADGGIYIIENASAKLSAGGNIAANRIIYGASTLLGNPVDIAFDDRNNKSLIYIAEKANKRILTFKLSDNGNVAPTTNITSTRLPEDIFLDAR